MRLLLGTAAAAALAAAAAPASAITFVGSFTETHSGSDPGLVIRTTALNPSFTVNLNTVGETKLVNLFRIWTIEQSVDGDDLIPRPITINFAFTAPGAANGGLNGVTGGLNLFLYNTGYLTWQNNGVRTFDFGKAGLLQVDLENGLFNSGTTRLRPGVNNAATITAEFKLLRGAVPEPGTWAMMIGGFGMAGYALRRRRSLAAA